MMHASRLPPSAAPSGDSNPIQLSYRHSAKTLDSAYLHCYKYPALAN